MLIFNVLIQWKWKHFNGCYWSTNTYFCHKGDLQLGLLLPEAFWNLILVAIEHMIFRISWLSWIYLSNKSMCALCKCCVKHCVEYEKLIKDLVHDVMACIIRQVRQAHTNIANFPRSQMMMWKGQGGLLLRYPNVVWYNLEKMKICMKSFLIWMWMRLSTTDVS